MRKISLLFVAAILVNCQSNVAKDVFQNKQQLANLEVVSVSKPQFASGFVKSWALIEVAKQNGNAFDLHALYFSKEQAFPNIGEICSATITKSSINGVTARGDIDERLEVIVVAEMVCQGETFTY